MIHLPKTLMAVLSLGLLSAAAHGQTTPAGLWKTIDDETKKEKSLIRITETNGMFTGKLEKLLDPGSKADAICDKCTDERQDKPLVGMALIKGVRLSDSDKALWDGGEILDPANGKTYKVRLVPGDGGKTLGVRGYIGAPMIGRTQTWLRVE